MQIPSPAGRLPGLSPLLSVPLASRQWHLLYSTGIVYVSANEQQEAGAVSYLSVSSLGHRAGLMYMLSEWTQTINIRRDSHQGQGKCGPHDQKLISFVSSIQEVEMAHKRTILMTQPKRHYNKPGDNSWATCWPVVLKLSLPQPMRPRKRYSLDQALQEL